jgi:Spy/CpxP family protein refolding chaperone
LPDKVLPDKDRGWLLIVIAVAGLAIGFAASSLAYRYRWLGLPHEPFIERMQHELKLTPTQRDQILQIINETRAKVMNLRQEFEQQRRDQMRQARARVHALLTPEQQERFDREFRQPPDHDRGRGMHEGESGPPEGPPEGGGPPPGGGGPPP